MNRPILIKQYFSSISDDITIDVFDEKNIYDVYQRVVANRANVAAQYNETFLNDNELTELW